MVRIVLIAFTIGELGGHVKKVIEVEIGAEMGRPKAAKTSSKLFRSSGVGGRERERADR